MSIEELKQIAGKTAKEQGVEKVFCTTDGQAFLVEHYANLHAKNKGLKVFPFDFTLEVEETKPLSVKDIIAEMEKAETIEALEPILPADEKRKTVLEAYELQKGIIEESKESK